MEYSHISIPFKNIIFNIVNEHVIGFFTKKLPQVNIINEKTMLTNVVEEELYLVDLVLELMINQIESKCMGNYVILKDIIDLIALTIQELRKQELWNMHFDGAKSRNGASVRVILRSPSGETKKCCFYLYRVVRIIQWSIKPYA